MRECVSVSECVSYKEKRSNPRKEKTGERKKTKEEKTYLLLHRLVNCDTVLLAHFVKLVNAADATVRKHHGASLEVKLALGIANKGCCET